MKLNHPLFLILAGAAQAVPVAQQAAPPKSLEQVAPPMKPLRVIEDEPLIRPDSKRTKVIFGPFVLPGAKVTPFYHLCKDQD
jgi:hypothetical protein